MARRELAGDELQRPLHGVRSCPRRPPAKYFRLPSYVLRFALQRRFGFHLSMMTDVMADGIYSQHDLPFDALGDVAQKERRRGGPPDARHKEVLLDLVDLLRGKLGRGAVEHEFHTRASLHRPLTPERT